ncbi:DUF6056 family protein [Clostridium saccharoperbutylacetonicum]|uniref:DUF6056 family protein n=1 Tax=Clostridium saccharoperbutylacetonicum TaxID=36745 RepID=UPI0009839EFC|nr:DUF6056 family protein [Clostridium saccharoperbutylacetonicum]AQR97821.1 hypothetical protein CLSAP_51540 [Clostridium saccharoperbutylacetonicum]NSB33711.1 hypothetical protein [Clostridium saccharoperbutylacetonicum]
MEQLIKKYRSKFQDNTYMPFVVLLIGEIMLHLLIKLNYGDDIMLSGVLKDNNIFQWAIGMYQGWSSRFLVQFALAIVLGTGVVLWRIIDIAMILLLALSISKLFVKNKRNNWLVVALIMIYPFQDMRTAGWGATTIGDLWSLALGIYSFVIWKKIIFDEKIKKYDYVFSTLAVLYACSVEQMCGIIIGTYVILMIYMAAKKKTIKWFMIFSFMLSIVNLMSILLCPGNKIRNSQQIIDSFPDFNQLSFLGKVQLGFSSSMAKYIFEPKFVFIIFALLIAILVAIKEKSKLKRIIGCVPIIAVITIGIGCFGIKKIFPNIPNIINSMTKYGIIDLWNYNNMFAYFPLILLVLVEVCILVSIYYCYGKTIKTLLALFILLIGLASRVVMGFSPSIWVSADRTFIFMYFSIILASIILYEEISKQAFKWIKYINYFIMIIAILSFCKLIFYVITAEIFVNKANFINYIKSKLQIGYTK